MTNKVFRNIGRLFDRPAPGTHPEKDRQRVPLNTMFDHTSGSRLLGR